MNDNNKALQTINDSERSELNFEELEVILDSDLERSLSDLELLKENREKIGNPVALSDTVMNVVWEQFVNQVGAVAGEEFIRENRGLTLDLRDSAHIQTTQNFENGIFTPHNPTSEAYVKENYKRYTEVPHGKFRDEYVDPNMNATLKRAGKLHEKGIEYVKDIYTGRQIPTQTKLENGKNNPMAAQREHVKASATLYEDTTLQMSYDSPTLAGIINNPENLQGYTTAKRNNDKSDYCPDDMSDRDKTKHWESANELAEKFIESKRQEGLNRLRQEGKKSQKEETVRMGRKVLQGIAMGLLAALVKTIFQKLVIWLKSKEKSLSSFVDKIKEAIHKFVKDLKEQLKIATQSAVGALATMIFGPIVRTLQKVWTFLKQGYKSIKEAIAYIKDPANKTKPFSILMMEVGKIIIAGASAVGAMVLAGTIEGTLSTVPFFAFEIPMLGSLASILSLFLGGLISGLVGAIALNLIDKWIAKKQRTIQTGEIIKTQDDVLRIQSEIINISEIQTEQAKRLTAIDICSRHQQASEIALTKIDEIDCHRKEIEDTSYIRDITLSMNGAALDDIIADLDTK